MKFEKIKKDNRKKYIIGSLAILMLASVIFFVATRANYRVTEKVNIANGIINYSQSDLNVMAIKLQNSSGGYDNSNSVPTNGYTLSDKSYCEVNGTKDTSISMEYKDGRVIIPVNTKNTKCYLYFDIKLCPNGATACESILANKTVEERTNFSTVLTENTTGKIYTAEDDDGTSYYFAGAVDNNWVKFGGFYWRIIRINGDGTIRMIYNGTTTNQTSETTQIGGSEFNSNGEDNAYVGYMYGTPGSSTYNATHTNTTNSNVKNIVDNWYNTNLNKDGIKEHIDSNAGFCGDRTSNTSYNSAPNGSGGYKKLTTYYGADYRLRAIKKPSLKCTNTNDLYTTTSSVKGNKALTNPVGLISADEVAYAGGVYNTVNRSYYLYTNQAYWTMSPCYFDGYYARVFIIGSDNLKYYTVDSGFGVRPVINLKSNTQFSKGNGTKTSPFEI